MDIVQFTQNKFPFLAINEEISNMLKNSVTSKMKNPLNNYERLELLGDSALYYTFINYCYTQKPYSKMFSIEYGETICTRLRIKYLSTKYLSRICKLIGLDKFLNIAYNELKTRDQLEEDILEAWLGACSLFLSHEVFKQFIFELFDLLNLDLSFESCFDIKTRLNDLASILNCKFINKGTCFVEERQKFYSQMTILPTYENLIGIGFGDNIAQSENEAANHLFKLIKSQIPNFEYYYKNTKNWKKWNKFFKEYSLKRKNNHVSDIIKRKKL